jgi:hypothetical protein
MDDSPVLLPSLTYLELGNPLNLISYSFEVKFLATCAKDDRFVKIWYDQTNFFYVPHPTAVRHIQWIGQVLVTLSDIVRLFRIVDNKFASHISSIDDEWMLPETQLVDLPYEDGLHEFNILVYRNGWAIYHSKNLFKWDFISFIPDNANVANCQVYD